MNGDSVVEARHLECIFKRMTRRILSLSQQDWDTRGIADAYIIWSPRCYNTPPDHLCNAVMDNRVDHLWCDAGKLEEARKDRQCIKVCVDAGMRGSPGHPAQAAMGIAIYRRIVQQSGLSCRANFLSAQQLDKVTSAFQSEAMALEYALDTFTSFM